MNVFRNLMKLKTNFDVICSTTVFKFIATQDPVKNDTSGLSTKDCDMIIDPKNLAAQEAKDKLVYSLTYPLCFISRLFCLTKKKKTICRSVIFSNL